MPYDENGLTTYRQDEWYDRLKSAHQALADVEISERSALGHIYAVVSQGFAEVHETLQWSHDGQNILNSEGSSLVNHGITLGLRHNLATATTGNIFYIGSENTVIPADTEVESLTGNLFLNEEEFVISGRNCKQAYIWVNHIEDNDVYRVKLNGAVYEVTTGIGWSHNTLITQLASEMVGASGVSVIAFHNDSPDPDNYTSYLRVFTASTTEMLDIQTTTYLSLDQVWTPNRIRAKSLGKVSGDPNSVTNISKSIDGWYDISQPDALTVGREDETDPEFLVRCLQAFAATGAGTPDSIAQAVSNVTGVVAQYVDVNNTDAVVNGVPAYHMEVLVDGGLDQDIIDAIGKTAPGLPLHGDVTGQYVDFNGYAQPVKFSRPTVQYMYLIMDYTVHPEETLPADFEDQLSTAFIDYTESNLGLDTNIPTKRYAGIAYNTVSGLEEVTIRIAIQNPLDENTPPQPIDYSQNNIPISRTEIAKLALTRITYNPL